MHKEAAGGQDFEHIEEENGYSNEDEFEYSKESGGQRDSKRDDAADSPPNNHQQNQIEVVNKDEEDQTKTTEQEESGAEDTFDADEQSDVKTCLR